MAMQSTRGNGSHAHQLIRASAGTGKTYRLSSRFVELLRDGVPCDRILATTFTRKAAGEILDRVILRLAEACDDAAKRRELAESAGGSTLSRAACLQLLAGVVHSLHRLRVGTLDSFFAQVARGFALELGLPAGWQIVDELEESRLRSAAVAAVLARDEPARLRTLVNLLTKGAASRSVSQLLRDTIGDAYELFLETEPEAWKRVPRSKPLTGDELAATLEELRTLTLPGALAGARDGDYDCAIRGDWDTLLTKGLAAKIHQGETTYSRKPIPPEAVAVYERLLRHVRSDLVGRVALQTEATHDLLVRFQAEYERLQLARRGLRFGDIARRLGDLRRVADGAALAFRLDSHIDHLLLDEFQDTAPLQWRVLRPLAERVTARQSGGSFFCVGDVKQAIYGWRGGVAEIFEAVAGQLPDLDTAGLNISYRSAPPVIETVNRVFAGMTAHPNLGRAETAVRRWSERFATHETTLTTLPGYVALLTTPQPADPAGARDTVLTFAAQQVADFVRQSPAIGVGVLVRKNDTVARLIYLLRNLGVPASEEGGHPLTDSAAIQIVLSLLKLADHPADTVARFHVAHSPLAAHVGLTDYADGAQARHVAQSVRTALLGQGYGPLIAGWAERLATHCNRRELSRLEQLVELAYAYDGEDTLRTVDFVERVKTQRVADPLPAAVRVMTVHQAKGLEFDAVFLPELDVDLVGQPPAFVTHRPDVTTPADRLCRYAAESVQRMLPPAWQEMFSAATDAAVSEALCVLYVAMTRAVQGLYMIVAPSKPNAKAFPRTYAGLLRAALRDDQPAPPEAVLYHCGDAQWFARRGTGDAQPGAASGGPEAGPAGEETPLAVRLAPLAGPRHRGWVRARPSGLEGGTSVQLAQVLVGGRAAALLRGQLIHAWFEQVQWLDDGPPGDAALRKVADRLLTDAGGAEWDVAQELTAFRAMLQRPGVAEMLVRSRYQDVSALGLPPAVQSVLAQHTLVPIVQNERSFAVHDGEQLLTGFVDRLVLLQHGSAVVAAEIVDYKTDVLAADQPQKLTERAAFYAPQLNAYRRAVARLTRLAPDRIAAWLIFVEAGMAQPVAP
jgi:ATP-dependent exoDNAse (exonuclease V) beta subunit